jgi:hypothetical protein
MEKKKQKKGSLKARISKASKNINRFGLSRNLPSDVSFVIRKNSGFGCVVCGTGLIEYEHVDPPFKLAKAHDPAGMTLLCPNCHGRKTRRFLSIETIKECMQNPKCLEQGFAKDVLDVGKGFPTLQFAGVEFKNCRYPLVPIYLLITLAFIL